MATIPSFNPLAFSQLQSHALPSSNDTGTTASRGEETSAPSSPTDSVTLSSPGERYAQSVLDAARTNDNLKKKRCFKFVKEGLAAEGIELTGLSAYTAAPQLARNSAFQEMKGIKPSELSELPAGAVVVWNRSKDKKHPHGHISVALGDGREVSDRIRPQVEGYGTAVRVFLPTGGQTTLTAQNGTPTGAPRS